jgi:integrase
VGELLDDLLTDYTANDRKSLDGVTRIAARLTAAFGHRRAHDLTTADVQRYVVARQAAPDPEEHPEETGAENATINRELAALKRAFNLALKGEKILRKPYIPMLAEHNTRTGFLGEIEYLALRDALPPPINHVLAFAYVYGWRKSEILALTWDRVDLTAGTVRLDPDTTKNDEGRLVVLTVELRALFGRLWAETKALAERKGKPIPWVFHRRGRPVKDFRGTWETACAKVGLAGKVPHDLRRTAVRNMERAGVPRSVAMKITGHKTEAIYRRYAIVSEADLREAARKLSGEAVPGTIPGTVGHSEALTKPVTEDNLSE